MAAIGGNAQGGSHWGSGVRIADGILYPTWGLGTGRRLVNPRDAEGIESKKPNVVG